MTRDDNWRLRAACLGKADDLDDPWFPVRADAYNYAAAIEICMTECPVRRDCLDFALSKENTEEKRHGVYGGRTPDERKEIAARRQAAKFKVVTP